MRRDPSGKSLSSFVLFCFLADGVVNWPEGAFDPVLRVLFILATLLGPLRFVLGRRGPPLLVQFVHAQLAIEQQVDPLGIATAGGVAAHGRRPSTASSTSDTPRRFPREPTLDKRPDERANAQVKSLEDFPGGIRSWPARASIVLVNAVQVLILTA